MHLYNSLKGGEGKAQRVYHMAITWSLCKFIYSNMCCQQGSTRTNLGYFIAIYSNRCWQLAECTTHVICMHMNNWREKRLQRIITWQSRDHYVVLFLVRVRTLRPHPARVIATGVAKLRHARRYKGHFDSEPSISILLTMPEWSGTEFAVKNFKWKNYNMRRELMYVA